MDERRIVQNNDLIPLSDWDGLLPGKIAKNEHVWWEVFPLIKPHLLPRLFQLLGGAKQLPSREAVGKVVLVASIKENLKQKLGLSATCLMNDWGCYCQKATYRGKTVYMAGIATKPFLSFSVPFEAFAAVNLRFYGRVDQELNLSKPELRKLDQSMKDTLAELGILEECEIQVNIFKPGLWEEGLDMAFKAAIWLSSNRKEALASIWKMKG
jgi:hypothetical protein